MMEQYNISQEDDGSIVVNGQVVFPIDMCGCDHWTIEQKREFAKLIQMGPRMLDLLKTLDDYEDDRPNEGTRGAEIYHDLEELLCEFTQ